MKIELEEKDIAFANNINKDLEDGENVPLFVNEIGKHYFIDFSCTDIGKANAFIDFLMNPNNNKELEEKLGMEINAICYSKNDAKIDTLKEYLRDFLENLDNI